LHGIEHRPSHKRLDLLGGITRTLHNPDKVLVWFPGADQV
jgi:hypothetical protein